MTGTAIPLAQQDPTRIITVTRIPTIQIPMVAIQAAQRLQQIVSETLVAAIAIEMDIPMVLPNLLLIVLETVTLDIIAMTRIQIFGLGKYLIVL